MHAKVKQAARAIVPKRFEGWSIEVAMRYLPLVRQATKLGYQDQITEIGSGEVGATPYLRRRLTGVDQGFSAGNPLMEQVEASVLDLQFRDRSRPYVLSTDMLEHIPPGVRQQAVDELVRVARDYLVVAVPAGRPSEEQDRRLDQAYMKAHGQRFDFLIEHVDNGLPSQDDLDRYLRTALAKHDRPADIAYVWNSNLALRYVLMRCWISGTLAAKALLQLLIFAHPLLSRANFGTCYRLAATVHFLDGPTATGSASS